MVARNPLNLAVKCLGSTIQDDPVFLPSTESSTCSPVVLSPARQVLSAALAQQHSNSKQHLSLGSAVVDLDMLNNLVEGCGRNRDHDLKALTGCADHKGCPLLS